MNNAPMSEVHSETSNVSLHLSDYLYQVLREASIHMAGEEDLKDFAAQLACLFGIGDARLAVALDQMVVQIQNRAPDRFDWVGIYLLRGGSELFLAAFRGEKTPHTVIPVAEGICGAAVREERILNIPDVKADPRYLSCSIKTKSEIVVPIFDKSGKVVGEIDIDSHKANAFTAQDEQELAKDAAHIARELSR